MLILTLMLFIVVGVPIYRYFLYDDDPTLERFKSLESKRRKDTFIEAVDKELEKDILMKTFEKHEVFPKSRKKEIFDKAIRKTVL